MVELAETTSTNADALYRLLRALASVGIFAEGEPRQFALTPLAEPLRSDVPGSANGTPIIDANLDEYGDKTAFEQVTGDTELTGIGYDEARRIVKGVAASLAELGIDRGDRDVCKDRADERYGEKHQCCLGQGRPQRRIFHGHYS